MPRPVRSRHEQATHQSPSSSTATDISSLEVRIASTTNSTGWPPEAPGVCTTTRSTGSKTKVKVKVKADTVRQIDPFLSDSFARSSRDPETAPTVPMRKIASHQGLWSGRRGTRTPDLSRVKATTWSFTVQPVGPKFILSRDFMTGRDRR